MSTALLAHVVVSDTARFDVEQKALGRQPLTADDGEMLLALVYARDEAVELAESEADAQTEMTQAAEKERAELAEALRVERARLALVPDETRELIEHIQALKVELREANVTLAEMRHAKPYRYIRSARTRAGVRWALWERPTGERAKRVGTAHDEDEARAFLKGA